MFDSKIAERMGHNMREIHEKNYEREVVQSVLPVVVIIWGAG